MARLEIRLFGHLEFAVDGTPWRFTAPPRAAVVLGYLLLRAGESISRTALATLIWPDDAEEEARGKLRRHLHRIAKALPPCALPWITVTASTVRFDPRNDVVVDLHEFEAAAESSQRAEAIALYRGDLLEDLYEEWILVDRERVRSTFLELCYEAAQQARRDRDFDAAIRYADRMLGVDEWREDALRLAMAARYESGDRSGALAAFERFNAKLRSEMRVEPMVETIALRSAILENAPIPGSGAIEDDGSVSRTLPKTPFVGRKNELEALDALWLRAARGHGTTLFVGGAAGIGKSTLVGELSAMVNAQGGRTLAGGTSQPEAYPYEPVADALRRGLTLVAQSRTDRVWLSSLAALVPELYGAIPDLPRPETVEPAHARLRLFEAIVRCLEQLARVRPLLLVLEDVHWAQGATLDALEFLARRVGMLPVLVVATYRLEEVDAKHGLTQCKNRLAAERRANAMVLRPLEAADIAELVISSQGDAPDELAASIFRLSEGNPLLAGQLLRAYRESGERPSEEHAAQTVSDAIVVRFHALDTASRRLAETAAACGRSFTIDFAARVMGCREDEVLDGLGVLLDRGIVREAGGTKFAYAFTHALIAAAIYQATPGDYRVARHRRIAQLLAQNVDADRQSWASIARHWEAAGDRVRAADAYVLAGRAALNVYARQEAVAYARSALGLSESDPVRFEALEIAATAEMRASDVGTWDRDLNEMERIARGLGTGAELTVLRFRDLYASQVGDVSLKQRIVDGMFALASRASDATIEVEALIAQGGVGMRRIDLKNACSSLTRALELAEASGNLDQMARAREVLIQVLMRDGEAGAAKEQLALHRAQLEREGASPERRLSVLNPESVIAAQQEDGAALERVGHEMLELATRVGDVYFEGRAHTVLAHSAYIRQDYDAIRRHYETAIPLFELVGDNRALHATYINWSEFELRAGRFESALRLLDQTLPYVGRLETPDSEVVYAVNRATALLMRGSHAEALETARAANEMKNEMAEPRYVMEASIVLGAVESVTGARPAAIERLENAVSTCLEKEDWHNASDGLCWLIDAHLAEGAAAKAEKHGDRLASIFAAHRDAAVHATRVCWVLGRLAEAAGRKGESMEWKRRGVAFLQDALAKFENPLDVEAFCALPFNRALLEHANGRETRKVRRSS